MAKVLFDPTTGTIVEILDSTVIYDSDEFEAQFNDIPEEDLLTPMDAGEALNEGIPDAVNIVLDIGQPVL